MPSINRIFLEMLLVEKTETPRGELLLSNSIHAREEQCHLKGCCCLGLMGAKLFCSFAR